MATLAPIFTAWLDDFFRSYYRHRPVNATFIGVHEYDDRLPDYSERGVADVTADMANLLARLRALPPEPLTPSESLDKKLAGGFLEIQQWKYPSGHFQGGNPCVYTGEAGFGVMSLFLRPFAPMAQRVDAAIHRLNGIPVLLAQGQANVRAAPPAWTERAIRECVGALAFLKGGIDQLIPECGVAAPRLRAAADIAATAFADFQHYLQAELCLHPTDHYACGADAFALLLRQGHFLDLDARAVETRAREQFAACEAELEQHAADFGAHTWRDALARLADEHPPADQYYARHAELWEACHRAAHQHNLLTWPDYPLRFIPRPAWAREAAPYLYFLFYRSPAPYDDLPVTELLLAPITPEMAPSEQERFLRANNDSVIKLNHVVHHAAIGHHVQNWHAYRAASRIGQIAAVDCASRIAMFCGGTMAEGWACYATELMDEIGFLTPLEHYSMHQSRLRMAARAIADVKLHHGEWSLEDTTNFYRDKVGMSQEATQAEAVKNSMFPGAAMMYMIGTNLIHELRRDLAARQVAAFDLRRFHDRFLSYGSVPVSLISTEMKGQFDYASQE
jgi:hypothetical protein